MRRALAHMPALIAALLLGAHFSRWGMTAFVLLSGVVAVAVFVPLPAVRAAVRVLLALGAFEWLRTTAFFVAARIEGERPFVRLLAILLAVSAWTAWSAWLLPSSRRIERDAGRRAPD